MVISATKRKELEQERKELKARYTVAQKEQQEAAAFGDLSENEEYHAAVRECNTISLRLSEIDAVLADAEVNVETDNGPRIVIDSYVEITNKTAGTAPRIFRVDAEGDTLDPTIGKCVLSVDSPVGKEILNGTKGTYHVATKSGVIEYFVRKLTQKEVAELKERESSAT